MNSLAKKLFTVIFTETKFSEEKFCVYFELDKIVERVSDFKILHTQQTMPNIMTISHWKADELKTGLLYLVIPLLHEILPECFIQDLCKLHRAVTLLLKNEITKEDLVLARRFLLTVSENIAGNWHTLLAYIDNHRMIHLPLDTITFGNANKREGYHDEVGVYLTKCGM